jgi:RNA polymerase sigma-70 factor (ECF subfamily)
MTEEDLVAQFVARRPEALEEAYRLHASVLFSVARHVLGSDGDAADCVHDALMRVWTRPGSYRPERGGLRAFLSVCVRNEAIGRRRDAARHVAIERHLAEAGPERPYELDVDDFVERSRLREALGTLPAEQRTAVELAYFGHLSQTQIAERLGVPLGTIKSRIAMGLRKLQLAFPPERVGTV